MVQRVEHFGAELQIESFGQHESFSDSQIEIPVTWCFKNISSRAIASGGRYRKRTCILENDWTDDARDFLQSNLRHRSDDIRAGLMGEVRCADAAACAERLSGHERVNSVETPSTDHLVQRGMDRGSEPLLFTNGEFP